MQLVKLSRMNALLSRINILYICYFQQEIKKIGIKGGGSARVLSTSTCEQDDKYVEKFLRYFMFISEFILSY